MKIFLLRNLMFFLLFFSSFVYACGDNINAIVQGPFKDKSFDNGYICFQNTSDKRDVSFYLSYSTPLGEQNSVIDTYHYSDAPVELMSVFFATINGERNVVVLLRWNVNYQNKNILYPYYYEIKTYKKISDAGYVLNLYPDKDANLSGYQTNINGVMSNYPLDNAKKIKAYFTKQYTRQ